MDDVTRGILDYARLTREHPLPPDTTTRQALRALRAHLDDTVPDWRHRAFEAAPAHVTAVEVEFLLASGRTIRGVLVQRPSAVRGEAA